MHKYRFFKFTDGTRLADLDAHLDALEDVAYFPSGKFWFSRDFMTAAMAAQVKIL